VAFILLTRLVPPFLSPLNCHPLHKSTHTGPKSPFSLQNCSRSSPFLLPFFSLSQNQRPHTRPNQPSPFPPFSLIFKAETREHKTRPLPRSPQDCSPCSSSSLSAAHCLGQKPRGSCSIFLSNRSRSSPIAGHFPSLCQRQTEPTPILAPAIFPLVALTLGQTDRPPPLHTDFLLLSFSQKHHQPITTQPVFNRSSSSQLSPHFPVALEPQQLLFPLSCRNKRRTEWTPSSLLTSPQQQRLLITAARSPAPPPSGDSSNSNSSAHRREAVRLLPPVAPADSASSPPASTTTAAAPPHNSRPRQLPFRSPCPATDPPSASSAARSRGGDEIHSSRPKRDRSGRRT